MSEDEVKALVTRAQAGDEAAFYRLFSDYRETVARIVHRVMGPSPEIEDVVQDVFINVFRSIGSFRGDAKFSTWLYRLTANVTKMHLRKKKSRPRFADVPVVERMERLDHLERAGGVESPAEALAREERIEALYRLVHKLSDKKREVLVLHDFEGCTASEIAERVGIPVLTVRTRLFYARKELYAALSSEPSGEGIVDLLMDRLSGKAKRKRRSSSPANEARKVGP